MKREDLEGLTDEQKDLVMKLYGKELTKKNEEKEELENKLKEANSKITTYETKFKEFEDLSKDNEQLKAKVEELQTSITEQEAQRKAKEEENILNKNIETAIGEKKFTSKYAKEGFLSEIKSELSKPENKGKGITDIIDYLSKDQVGIFENPNKPLDMEGMGDFDTTISKEMFDKMSYSQRVQLKQDNPELFKKYNS